MDFISWNFILYLLAGVLIWIPVFLFTPFPLRTEGKWLITAVSFLLALLYLSASQVMSVWQSVLITVLLLGMAAYFIQQKGAKFLMADGSDDEEDYLESRSFEQEVQPELPLQKEETAAARADETIEWLETKPESEVEKPRDESQEEETWETDWYIDESGTSKDEEPAKVTEPALETEPELLDEWFENRESEEEEEEKTKEEYIEEDNVLDRDFLNELSEMQEPERIDSGEDEIQRPVPFAEADVKQAIASEKEEEDSIESGPDLPAISGDTEWSLKEDQDRELSEEEMQVFSTWFEEDASLEEDSEAGLDLDGSEPMDEEIDSEKEELVRESNRPDDETEKSKELMVQEEENVKEPMAEYKQKAMPDDLFESLYNQLLVLKETSHGYEFNAIMDEVLLQSKGIREYFVFAQLYLTYLEEAEQEIEFHNVYMEAMEHLKSYPYLKEQLSWTKNTEK